jgi:hypothetical protein
MSTEALTIQTQAEALQIDLAESIDQIFGSLPELQAASNLRDCVVSQSKQVTVTDSDSYIRATEQAGILKMIEEDFTTILDPYVARAYKLHKALTAYRTKVLSSVSDEQRRLKAQREAYAAEQERMRREAALKAQQEAQEREEARLIEEARQAAAAGDSGAAEAILEEAMTVEVAPVILPSTTPTIAGTSYRSVWEWKLLDIAKLKPEFLIPNEKAINANVRAMHKSAETLCGAGAIAVTERKIVIDR